MPEISIQADVQMEVPPEGTEFLDKASREYDPGELGQHDLEEVTEADFADTDDSIPPALAECLKSDKIGSRATKLSLKYLRLTKVPPSVSRLLHLQELDLSGNLLETFGSEVADLPNLRRLDLSYNKLKNVPSCVANMIELEYINLEGNEFPNPAQQKSLIQSLFPDVEVVV